MELVYLWIEDYKNIKEQGFNFSSKFRCEFEVTKRDENDKVINGNLVINQNEDDNGNKNYIENFFGDKINITAIVGKNGSGKSNILNIIFNSGQIPSEYFFIVRFGDDLKIYGLKIDRDYLNNTIKISQLKVKENNFFNCKDLKGVQLDDCQLAFFTPIFQNSFTENKHLYLNEKFNFSPVGLLEKYQEEDKLYKNLSFKNLYEIYESKLIENNINMITNTENLNLPFEIPKKITIHIVPVSKYELFDEDDGHKKYFFNKIRSEGDVKDFYKYTQQRVILNYFNNFIDNLDDDSEKKLNKIIEEIEKNKNELSIKDLIEIYSRIEYEIEGLEVLEKFLNDIKKLSKESKEHYFSIDIKNINDDLIKNYIDIQAKTNLSFLNFSWFPQLSGGQEIFLFQFSLLNQLKNKDKLILLIDEGETTLHPNWQKMYIKYIVEFIKNNFSKKVHIIFTSHSPFIISDLPKENIIFLDTDENGNCKVVNRLKEKKATFGANIHTLLSDSFFMNDGLMGEFAKDKIDEVITLLNKPKLSNDETKKCEQIINIIGEPIIKNQLQRMLDSKRLSKIDEIDKIKNEIEKLQNKLNLLENQNATN